MATIHQIFIWISHKDIENVNEMLSQILKTDAKMRALIPKLAQSSDASAPTLLECFLDWFKKRCCKYILRWCMYMYMLISRVGSEWSKAQTEDWRWLQGTSTIAWWYRDIATLKAEHTADGKLPKETPAFNIQQSYELCVYIHIFSMIYLKI